MRACDRLGKLWCESMVEACDLLEPAEDDPDSMSVPTTDVLDVATGWAVVRALEESPPSDQYVLLPAQVVALIDFCRQHGGPGA